MNADHSNLLPSRRGRMVLLLVFLSLLMASVQCICSVEGACVASGGSILDSPECMNDWTRGECEEWDDMEVNDANWDFHPLRGCEGLGYVEECSYGSFRLPGACN